MFWVIAEFLGPPCRPSKTLLLKVLPLIGPFPHAPLPRFAPVPLLAMKFPLNIGIREPAVLLSTLRTPSTKKPVPVVPLTTQLLVNQKPSKLSWSRWKRPPPPSLLLPSISF